MDTVLYDVDVRCEALHVIPLDQREPGRLVDSFRYFHPLETKAYTVGAEVAWSSRRACQVAQDRDALVPMVCA